MQSAIESQRAIVGKLIDESFAPYHFIILFVKGVLFVV